MNDLVLVLATAILTSGLLGVAYAVLSSRKSGELEVPWEKIRPILLYVFAKIVDLSEKQKLGYEAMEDFAVDLVYEQIQTTEFFTKEEKKFLNKDLIRALLKKKLKDLYEKDIK
jgi:hypothetical protein